MNNSTNYHIWNFSLWVKQFWEKNVCCSWEQYWNGLSECISPAQHASNDPSMRIIALVIPWSMEVWIRAWPFQRQSLPTWSNQTLLMFSSLQAQVPASSIPANKQEQQYLPLNSNGNILGAGFGQATASSWSSCANIFLLEMLPLAALNTSLLVLLRGC